MYSNTTRLGIDSRVHCTICVYIFKNGLDRPWVSSLRCISLEFLFYVFGGSPFQKHCLTPVYREINDTECFSIYNKFCERFAQKREIRHSQAWRMAPPRENELNKLSTNNYSYTERRQRQISFVGTVGKQHTQFIDFTCILFEYINR